MTCSDWPSVCSIHDMKLHLKFAILFFSLSAQAHQNELLFSRFASWGVDPDKGFASINLIEAWRNFKTHKPVVVAVIDTGIDAHHSFLANNIASTVDFTKSTSNDVHGHGTHIAGIIKSIYPEVRILPLKYYDAKQTADESISATVKAIKFAINANVDFINYSSAGSGNALEELKVLEEAKDKGILVIAAAGNKGENIDILGHASYPANYGLSNVITVAGYDDKLNIVSSSNFGIRSVDIAAPGHRIRGAFIGNRTAYMTGTSQATAFVTGVAALIKAKYPDLSGPQIKEIILGSVLEVKSFEGKVARAGKLDAARAMEFAERKINRLPANKN